MPRPTVVQSHEHDRRSHAQLNCPLLDPPTRAPDVEHDRIVGYIYLGYAPQGVRIPPANRSPHHIEWSAPSDPFPTSPPEGEMPKAEGEYVAVSQRYARQPPSLTP